MLAGSVTPSTVPSGGLIPTIAGASADYTRFPVGRPEDEEATDRRSNADDENSCAEYNSEEEVDTSAPVTAADPASFYDDEPLSRGREDDDSAERMHRNTLAAPSTGRVSRAPSFCAVTKPDHALVSPRIQTTGVVPGPAAAHASSEGDAALDARRQMSPTQVKPAARGGTAAAGKLSVSSLVDMWFRDFRAEIAGRASTSVLLLFAIPVVKRNGERNDQWDFCEMVEEASQGSSVPLQATMQLCDPINGDRIFAFELQPAGQAKSCRFFMRGTGGGAEDRPPNDRCYEIPIGSPGIYSLRDGELAIGDRIFDIGIALRLETPARSTPILHYFDETTGFWSTRPFVRQSGFGDRMIRLGGGSPRTYRPKDGVTAASEEYSCLLASARRTQCVVQVDERFMKAAGAQNHHIAWPGVYRIEGENLEEYPEENELSVSVSHPM